MVIAVETNVSAPSEGPSPTEFFYELLECANDPAQVTDAEHRLVYVNRAWCGALGYTREEIAGRSFFDLVHEDYREAARQHFARLVFSERGQHVNVECRLITKSGTHLPLAATVSARSEDGRLLGTCAFLRNMSAQLRSEDGLRLGRDELHAANAALQAASRAKDEFLANMSHELRTPLNSVLGLCEALADDVYGPLNDRQRASVARVEESGRHLLMLLNDILDLAKVESGLVVLEPTAIAPDDVVRSSLRLVQESAQRKNLRVVTRGCGLPAVMLDERRIKQVLVNLLSNAVKFTPAGGEIGIDAAASDGGDVLRFIVWDTGVGIDPADMPRLFRPFVQIDNRLSREHPGTGLGLALVRRLVDAHGGSVELESEPGKGSRFAVCLPLRPAERKRSSARVPAPQWIGAGTAARAPIVLAEDDDNNADLVHDTLAACGYDVHRAHDGMEAVRLVREVHPALILMDMQMPKMDGLAAIEAIRADPARGSVIILALTALAMSGDRERCLAAGADDYLAKPVSLRRLIATIETHLQRA